MNANPQQLLEKYSPEHIIERLEPYLTEQRRQRIDQVLAARLSSIQLAIEAPSDINNALAAIRTAEAMGVAAVHLINTEGDAKSIRVVTQGAFYWVDIHFYDSLDAFLDYAKQQQLCLCGGVMHADKPIGDVSVAKPICIMVGNEQRGLSDEAIAACDELYTIPMCGMSQSLNLSVSAAISLYDTTQRKRALLQQPGDLTLQQEQHARAKYYLNSINYRFSAGLLAAE